MARRPSPFGCFSALLIILGYLVFLGSFLGSRLFVSESSKTLHALDLLDSSHNLKSIPLFNAANHSLSLCIAGSMLGFLGQIASAIMPACPLTALPCTALIAMSLTGSVLTLLTLGVTQLASFVPASRAGCSISNQWPKTDGRDLFAIFGGNATALTDLEHGCLRLKNLQYWGTSMIVINALWFVASLVMATIFPPLYSTATFLYQLARQRLQRGRTFTPLLHPATLKSSACLIPSRKKALLATLLSCPGTLSALASHLHHADLLMLRRTHAVLATALPSATTVPLRRATCTVPKRACWACMGQVCSGCVHKRSLHAQLGARHLADCVPYCAWCYWRWLCSRRLLALGERSGVCKGHERREEGGAEVASGAGAVERRVEICRGCAELDDKGVVAVFERREMRAMTALAYRLKCEVCSTGVGGTRGACWWVCRACSAVCCWEGHREIESGVASGGVLR